MRRLIISISAMKKCIWCEKEESFIQTFNRKAHTFPQSLNGVNVCENVCDLCNLYFGSKAESLPSIELVLKEAFHLSQYILLLATNQNKNKRYTSEFFKLNFKSKTITSKFKYSILSNFQLMLGRQFRRGVYKIYLEERERQVGDALEQRFNFIRQFARYNVGDYPVFYHKPKFKVLPFSLPDIKNPTIRFTEYSHLMDKEYRIFDYQIMGYKYVIPTSMQYEINIEPYLKKIQLEDDPFGTTLIQIKELIDIDFMYLFMNDFNNY